MRKFGRVQVVGTTELPWRRMGLLSALVAGVWGRRWHIAPVLKGSSSSRGMNLACILSVKEGHWKVGSRREIARVSSLKRWFRMHRIFTVHEIQGKSLNALSKSGRQHRLRGQIDVMVSVRGIQRFLLSLCFEHPGRAGGMLLLGEVGKSSVAIVSH